MDTLTKEQRTRCMSRIRSKNTKPELAVRKVLTQLGLRYRLYVKTLPGKPDIVITKKRVAIFVNGCFWHQHEGCRRSTIPKSNTEYWVQKLEHNIHKQKADIAKLESLDWAVCIIWECQTKDAQAITKLVAGLING